MQVVPQTIENVKRVIDFYFYLHSFFLNRNFVPWIETRQIFVHSTVAPQ